MGPDQRGRRAKMSKFTKRQERAFMAHRHPGMIFRSGAWVGNDWAGMERQEVLAEMQAEIELANAGVAKIPAWVS